MSGVDPEITLHQDGPFCYRAQVEYTNDALDAMAQRAAERIEDELVQQILARLGYVKVVHCRDCKHGLLHGTECRHFAAYEPIAGGDECEEMTYSVKPDGFCAWGVRREDNE